MNIFYAIVGFVAVASDKMSRFRVNFIPSNLALIAATLFFGIFSLSEAITKNDASGWAFGIPCSIIGLLFLMCLLTRNTIFQPQSAPVSGAVTVEQFNGNLVFSGKLRLQEKVARRFTAMPARIIALENGALAIASNIDASSRMYGVVTRSRSGMWLSIPREGTLQMENGLFYYGFSGRPALRLKYEEELDGTKATAIIAFDSAAQRQAARALLSAGEAPQTSLNPAFSS